MSRVAPTTVTKARASDVRRRCATLIEGLVALRPAKRKSSASWIVLAGIFFVVASLAADRSVREAVTSWPSPPAQPVAVRQAPPRPRPIAPIRSLAIAPATTVAATVGATFGAPLAATGTPAPIARPVVTRSKARRPHPHASHHSKR